MHRRLMPLQRGFRPALTALFSAMLFLAAAAPARADFSQTGPKLVGTGASGAAAQGAAVAISGDGNTAVVGGPGDGGGVGACWIFTRSFATWTQEGGKLIGSNAIGNSAQGYSAAISNDGNTVIVGGYSDNANLGAAWVFVRNGTTWTEQAKLVGTGAVVGTVGSHQGSSVALSDDGNTAAVGAYSDDFNTGAMWIFTRSGTTWTQVDSKLVGSNASTSEQGWSVALSGDGSTAASGGERDTGYSGAVWIWTQTGGSWSQQGNKLTVGFVQFGISVALSADGNTLAAGGNRDNNYVGATWIFRRSGMTWSQQVKLVGSGQSGQSQQGYAVALAGDGDTFLTGGLGDNALAGAAWVFKYNGTVWSQHGSKLVGTGATGPSQQGVSLALSDDGLTALVGGKDDASVTGAVWPYSGAPPDIAVEQPSGSGIPDGGGRNVGPAIVGSPQSRTFTIRNLGNTNLTGDGGGNLMITIDGVDALRFTATPNSIAPVAPGGNATFSVQFLPNAGGTKNAAMHIASNDTDENPFDINLTAAGLTYTDDTDGDGLNDASEFNMAGFGFDWQVSQESMVNTLYDSANGANLYTPQQVQALNIGVPLIQRDSSGQFKLTIALKKATELTNFSPFAFTGIGTATTINGQGELEFQFTTGDNAAFFRLESH